MKLLRCLFAILLAITAIEDSCHAVQLEELSSAIERDALFLIQIPDTQSFSKGIANTDLFSHSSMKSILSAFDNVMVEAKHGDDDKRWSDELLGNISDLTTRGSATIFGYDRNQKVEIAIVLNIGNLEKKEINQKLQKIASQMGALSNAMFPSAKPLNEEELTELNSSDDNIAELALFKGTKSEIRIPYLNISVPNSLFWFVQDRKLFVSTNKDVAQSLEQGLKSGADRPLSKYRTFTGTRSRIESDSNTPDAWIYVEPKHFKGQLSLDSNLTFNMFLPEFHQKLEGIQGSNQVASVGVKLKFNSNWNEDDSERKPVVSIDGFVKLRLPLSGPLAALRSTKHASFPPVFYNKIDATDVVNSNYEEVFDLLGKEYERTQKTDFAIRSNEISTMYRNSYEFEELYNRLEGVCSTIWRLNEEGGVERVRMMKFDSPESAKWFAEQASNSGFMNQKFVFEEFEFENNQVFMRSDATLEAYRENLANFQGIKMSLKDLKRHQKIFVAIDNWYIDGPKQAIAELISNFGMDEGVPQNVEHVLRETMKFSGFVGDPFYYSYRGKFWEARRVRQYLDLLSFAERPKPFGVKENTYAPKTLAARTVMTVQCLCMHAFNEKLGDKIYMASVGEDALHFAVGCFRPEGENTSISPPNLSKYAKAEFKQRSEPEKVKE